MAQGMRQKFFFSLSVASALGNAAFDAAPPAPPLPPGAPARGSAPPDFHRVAYVERGDPQGDHIICVHGIARNARDFDLLAERLSQRACVVCPDVVGRGRSDWLSDPDIFFGYTYAQYMLDATALIARLGVEEVDWVGTSLGGLLGMMMAAAPRSPVRRLVLNDIGPRVTTDLFRRLLKYLAEKHSFNSPEELRAFMSEHYAGRDKYGPLTEAQLRQMTKYSECKSPDGRIGLAFDHENMRVLKWLQDTNQPQGSRILGRVE